MLQKNKIPRGFRKTSENMSTVEGKSGDRIVNETETPAVFNAYFKENRENLAFRSPKVDVPLMRQNSSDFCVLLYPTNDSFQNHSESCEKASIE